MKRGEYNMQAFRSSNVKMEPLCLPPPPPPPIISRPSPPRSIISRPSFMPPPPPPLSQSVKRYDFSGRGLGARPVQNRFSKSADQRLAQRPQHLPFLPPPPPPPRITDEARRRHSSAQYRSGSLVSSLHGRNRKVKAVDSTTGDMAVTEEGLLDVKSPFVKEEPEHTEIVIQDQLEDKSCTSDGDTPDSKTNRKRPAEKELHVMDGAFSGLPKELSKKFAPLKCDLCSVAVNSTVQAKMHYSGKLHEKKVHTFLLNWSKETGEPLPKQFKHGPPKKQITPKTSFCEICNVGLTSVAHAEQHYMGRNHQRVLAGHAAAKVKVEHSVVPADDQTQRFGIGSQFQPWANTDPLGLQSPEPNSVSLKRKKYSCELCKVTATSKDQLDMHLRGAKHRKADTANKLRSATTSATPQAAQSDSILASVMQNDDGTQNTVGKDYSIYRTPSGYYYCQPCNITLNSEAQFIQHCESKKHKFKTATIKKPNSKPLKVGNVVA